MGGIIGRQFHDFPVTLGVAILVSGVVSWTVTPMLCSRLIKEERSGRPNGRFYRATKGVFNGVLGFYARSLRWVLKHSFLMLLVTVVTIVLTIWLYGIVPKGFFLQQDTGSIMRIIEVAQDISFGL